MALMAFRLAAQTANRTLPGDDRLLGYVKRLWLLLPSFGSAPSGRSDYVSREDLHIAIINVRPSESNVDFAVRKGNAKPMQNILFHQTLKQTGKEKMPGLFFVLHRRC
jgi:hypothetical protein